MPGKPKQKLEKSANRPAEPPSIAQVYERASWRERATLDLGFYDARAYANKLHRFCQDLHNKGQDDTTIAVQARKLRAEAQADVKRWEAAGARRISEADVGTLRMALQGATGTTNGKRKGTRLPVKALEAAKVKQEHPEMFDKDIACQVGCTANYLSRSPVYQWAKQAAVSDRGARRGDGDNLTTDKLPAGGGKRKARPVPPDRDVRLTRT